MGEIFGNKDYLRDNKCLSSIEYIGIKNNLTDLIILR